MTLITVGDNYGQRRCDANCYNASGAHCDCVCGGRNHGKGLAVAQDNTRRAAVELLKRAGAEIPPEILQGELL
jgi:hypothetical protein